MNPLNHVAIIMDGNGRWGLKYKYSRNAGHKAGLHAVEKIIKETINQKIKYASSGYSDTFLFFFNSFLRSSIKFKEVLLNGLNAFL